MNLVNFVIDFAIKSVIHLI